MGKFDFLKGGKCLNIHHFFITCVSDIGNGITLPRATFLISDTLSRVTFLISNSLPCATFLISDTPSMYPHQVPFQFFLFCIKCPI